MSIELVPLSYARDAYNVLHGTELRTHTDALTAEQASRINSNYDIEVHVGTHGQAPGAHPDNPYAVITLPTQQEYQEVAAVVAGMQPGDTLFSEGYGFRDQPPEPVMIPNRPTTAADGPAVSFFERMFSEHRLALAHELRAAAGRRLEELRRDYKIDAWDYARQLAILKGVRTVYADHDIFDDELLDALGQNKDLLRLTTDSNPEERALAERIHVQRERKARNIVKDWALDHLPPKGMPPPNGRKPKLVLLFGGLHKEGLKRAFDDLGLDTKVTVMESSDFHSRTAEQMLRAMNGIMATLMPSLLDAADEKPSGGTPTDTTNR